MGTTICIPFFVGTTICIPSGLSYQKPNTTNTHGPSIMAMCGPRVLDCIWVLCGHAHLHPIWAFLSETHHNQHTWAPYNANVRPNVCYTVRVSYGQNCLHPIWAFLPKTRAPQPTHIWAPYNADVRPICVRLYGFLWERPFASHLGFSIKTPTQPTHMGPI